MKETVVTIRPPVPLRAYIALLDWKKTGSNWNEDWNETRSQHSTFQFQTLTDLQFQKYASPYPMRRNSEQKWRVGWGAVFKVCDLLESYDLASLLAELFLLADSQPTRHFCSPFLLKTHVLVANYEIHLFQTLLYRMSVSFTTSGLTSRSYIGLLQLLQLAPGQWRLSTTALKSRLGGPWNPISLFSF